MGEVDPTQLRRHQVVLEMENRLRAGSMSVQDLNQQVIDGQIAPKQAREITNNVKNTHEMDPDNARLWSLASRAPMKEFIKIYALATPGERDALSKLLLQKKKAYLHNAMTNMTPQERRDDPTLKWIARTFPGTPLF